MGVIGKREPANVEDLESTFRHHVDVPGIGNKIALSTVLIDDRFNESVY